MAAKVSWNLRMNQEVRMSFVDMNDEAGADTDADADTDTGVVGAVVRAAGRGLSTPSLSSHLDSDPTAVPTPAAALSHE
jgi:hypothetical protein